MERRTFLKWATHGLGVLFGVVLGAPVVAYLIDPRNRPAPAGDFKPVARLSDLQPNVPKQVVIRDVRSDAWTLHPNDVVGRVWLIRRDNNEVEAFTTICPHLGCSINFEEGARKFVCPCHGGTFEISGDRVSNEKLGHTNPAPRGMDSLPINKVPNAADPKDFIIEVKYENFKQGEEHKVRKA